MTLNPVTRHREHCREARASMSDYLDGELDEPVARRLRRHVRWCPSCQRFPANCRRPEEAQAAAGRRSQPRCWLAGTVRRDRGGVSLTRRSGLAAVTNVFAELVEYARGNAPKIGLRERPEEEAHDGIARNEVAVDDHGGRLRADRAR